VTYVPGVPTVVYDPVVPAVATVVGVPANAATNIAVVITVTVTLFIPKILADPAVPLHPPPNNYSTINSIMTFLLFLLTLVYAFFPSVT